MMQNKKIFGLERNIFFAGMVSLFMDMSSEMIYPRWCFYQDDCYRGRLRE